MGKVYFFEWYQAKKEWIWFCKIVKKHYPKFPIDEKFYNKTRNDKLGAITIKLEIENIKDRIYATL